MPLEYAVGEISRPGICRCRDQRLRNSFVSVKTLLSRPRELQIRVSSTRLRVNSLSPLTGGWVDFSEMESVF